VEGPQLLARAHVVAAHIARCAAFRRDGVVADHLDHDDVPDDDAGCGRVDVLHRARIVRREQFLFEVDLAVDAEIRVGLACHSVDGKQAAIN
jgi:hypothetical protein